MNKSRHVALLGLLAAGLVCSPVLAGGPSGKRNGGGKSEPFIQSAAISLAHTDCEQVAGSLNALFGREKGRTRITCYQPKNMLLIRGNREELDEIKSLAATIDTEESTTQSKTASAATILTKLVPVEHAEAVALHRVLYEVFQKQIRSGSVNFTVDERTNIIILSGAQPTLEVISSLISSLDVELPGDEEKAKKTSA